MTFRGAATPSHWLGTYDMATLELMTGLIVYAFVTTITPGPNNTMLVASGVNFGFARSVPHILGISIGFSIMVMLVGTGLGTLFEAFPLLHNILRWVGFAYLAYLAWMIARSQPYEFNDDDSNSSRPMSFLAAAAFQWVNPKAWIMALGAITTYLPNPTTALGMFLVAAIFFVVGTPCISLWAMFGTWISRSLTNPLHFRIVNFVLAAALVLSLIPALNE